eukprot:619399-Rhodomonas_salina.2
MDASDGTERGRARRRLHRGDLPNMSCRYVNSESIQMSSQPLLRRDEMRYRIGRASHFNDAKHVFFTALQDLIRHRGHSCGNTTFSSTKNTLPKAGSGSPVHAQTCFLEDSVFSSQHASMRRRQHCICERSKLEAWGRREKKSDDYCLQEQALEGNSAHQRHPRLRVN